MPRLPGWRDGRRLERFAKIGQGLTSRGPRHTGLLPLAKLRFEMSRFLAAVFSQSDVATTPRARQWELFAHPGHQFRPGNRRGVVRAGLLIQIRITAASSGVMVACTLAGRVLRESLEGEGRPGATPEQVVETLKIARHIAIDDRDLDAGVDRESAVLPRQYLGGSSGVARARSPEQADHPAADPLRERGRIRSRAARTRDGRGPPPRRGPTRAAWRLPARRANSRGSPTQSCGVGSLRGGAARSGATAWGLGAGGNRRRAELPPILAPCTTPKPPPVMPSL